MTEIGVNQVATPLELIIVRRVHHYMSGNADHKVLSRRMYIHENQLFWLSRTTFNADRGSKIDRFDAEGEQQIESK